MGIAHLPSMSNEHIRLFGAGNCVSFLRQAVLLAAAATVRGTNNAKARQRELQLTINGIAKLQKLQKLQMANCSCTAISLRPAIERNHSGRQSKYVECANKDISSFHSGEITWAGPQQRTKAAIEGTKHIIDCSARLCCVLTVSVAGSAVSLHSPQSRHSLQYCNKCIVSGNKNIIVAFFSFSFGKL